MNNRRHKIIHFFHSKYMQIFMISQNLSRKNAFFLIICLVQSPKHFKQLTLFPAGYRQVMTAHANMQTVFLNS